ncbi:MAG: hypothetical protein GY750_12830 [Lentisphaerae bacterium]|nr:hypothetical protein [Lentisphaerota bacterium]MCP4102298.1 hypothetical protein [Lentisphaerota bacterium]
MGATNGAVRILKFTKSLKVAILALSLLTPLLLFADAEDIRGFKTFNARLPIYHKQRLQFLIYSTQVTKQGSKILADDAIIDIVRKGVDLDHIQYMDGVKPYPLGSPYSVAEKFWLANPHSEGYVASSKASIDQATKTASGNREVFLRSPQMDLNGVGFTANFDKRIVHVGKDVHIIIRIHSPRSSKPATAKQKAAIIKVTADRMEADFSKEIVTLIGNVKVNEARFKIDCDRLMVDLNRSRKGDANSKDDMPGGISKITCLGNVKINRKLSPQEIAENGEQRAYADTAVYDTIKGEIQLLGKNPRIMRGSDFISGKRIIMWKDKERMKVFGNGMIRMRLKRKGQAAKGPLKPTVITSDYMDLNYAGNLGIFVGNVHIDDASMNLDCKKMTLYLVDTLKDKTAATEPKPVKPVELVPSTISTSGKKQVERIICVGDVVVTRRNGTTDVSERALAGRAVYLLKNSCITLSEDNPIIIRGRDSISGREMTVWLDQNRLQVDKNSRIVLNKLRKGQGVDQKMVKTVVTSDKSDLNYGSGKLYFEGLVNVKDPALKLDCTKMTIMLDDNEQKFADAGKAEKESSDDPFDNIGSGSGKKDIDKVVCIGKVQVEDPRAIVNCDKMTMTFKERPKGSENNAGVGALGSGSNREIDKIFCDGNFRLETKTQPQDEKTANKSEDEEEDDSLVSSMGKSATGRVVATSDDAMMDIPGNLCKLLGNVRVVEPRVTLDCKRMNIYAENVKPGELDKPIPLDDDELEANVPRRIAIGENKKLTKIICHDDVVISRVITDGERQQALGKKAVYDVFKRNIVLTGTPKKKPIMRQGDNVVEGDQITLWTDSEKLDIKNSRLKLADPDQLR